MRKNVFLISMGQLLAMSLAANILVLTPLGPRSHMNCFRPLVEVLAEKGHQLTVVTAHPAKIESRNVRNIAMKELVDLVEVEWYDFTLHGLIFNTIGVFQFFHSTMSVAYDRFMANEEIQEIKHNKNYDMVIVDGIVNDFTFPLVDHLGIPFIFFDPGPGTVWNLAAKDADREYASIPSFLGNHGSNMTFFQRMANLVVSELFLAARHYFLLRAFDELAKKDFPHARPIAEIERDAQLTFANIHPTTSYMRPLPATIIPVGAMHVRPVQKLQQDLQSFVDGAEEGIIIFTLGSNSQVSLMPIHIQKAFVRTFARLPQRVLWKWEKDSQLEFPPNVKIVDWLPQQDLLGNKKTRLFIAHGGLMGIQEAIYHQVPILGLPLGRDQRFLLIKAEEDGWALKLEWEDVTEELLYDSIQKLIKQQSYKNNVSRLSRLMHDELIPSREIAAYWVEHVLRHGGAKHLQSKTKDVPFYQLYLLDVWAFIFSSLGFIIFVIYKSVVCIFRRITIIVPVKAKTH